MDFEILYCGPCGYRGRADDLATELREGFGANVSVEEGKFGQFDVLLEGQLVASKGGLLRRLLVHGAPPQEELLASIAKHVRVREGDACEVPTTRES